MKRVLGFFRRKLDDTTYQQRAIRKVERIQKGEKVLAPKHPTDAKAFGRALADGSLKEKVDTKNDDLVENMSKITVKSYDPPMTRKTKRPLPSSTDDVLLDQNLILYGFHEPPPEKIEENKLTFREGLEILRTRLELEDEQFAMGNDEQSKLRKINSQKFLENHPAVKRVDKQKLDTVFEYFRPFVHYREQRVIRKADAERLERLLAGDLDDLDEMKAKLPFYRRNLEEGRQSKTLMGKKNLMMLDELEQKKMLEGEKNRQLADSRRLNMALADLQKEIHHQPSDVKSTVDKPKISEDVQPKTEQQQ